MTLLPPVDVVSRAFGSSNKLAKALGIPPEHVSRWRRSVERRGCGGDIPRQYMRQILSIARMRGLDITADDLIFGRDLSEQTAG